MIAVAAAVLAAALAAPAPEQPAPAAAAPATPAASAPAPAAAAAAAAQGREALQKLLARELAPLAARPFKTAAGITGKVEAAAAPKVAAEAEGETVTIPLGTAEAMSCTIFPDRIDVAATVWRIVEATKQSLKVLSALPVDVVEVKGAGLVLAQVVYQVDGERGPLLGVLKLGVYAHPLHSLLCQHDEPGYGQSFARIVKGIAGSLAGPKPDPRAQARFAELSVVRLGALAVGYAEHLVTKGEGGTTIAEQFGAQLLPRGPADLVAIDSVSTETIDGQDLLAAGTYAHGMNGELDLTMTVTRADDGRTYAYAGEKDGKKLEGRFETKQGLSTDLWFARRFAARAAAKGEVRHEMYSVETNPVAAIPVAYRLDPAGPRRATMELGPMRLSGDLDPHGLFRTAEIPLGPATLVLTRVFERGTP